MYFKVSKSITLKWSVTNIYELDIDLDEWYSFSEMNEKQKHEKIQSILNNVSDFKEVREVQKVDEDFNLMEWDLR